MSAKTMLCAYCAVRKPWDREHFPDRMVAICVDCFPTAEKQAAERLPSRLESLAESIEGLTAAVKRLKDRA